MLRRGALGLALAMWMAAAGAQEPPREQPVLLTADEVAYDQELGIVTATGHVEIAQGERILLADKVGYNERTGVVTASGNVSVLEPTGEVLFADYVELTDELKNGFVRSVRLLLSDNSRLVANSAERSDGNRLVLSRAVYSPCNLCPEHPTRAPLWQIKAVQVVHNQAAKRIEYKDATMEAFGIPIAYTPYFSHPDPTVRRQSGILAPDISNNSFFGPRLQVPYFWAIDEQSDLTLTPQISGEQGAQIAGLYRARTQTGEYRLEGSFTRPDERDPFNNPTGKKESRGHVRADGRFRIEDETLAGFNIYRSSDDTYLRRYDIERTQLNSLTSRLYVERFRGASYGVLNAYGFQDLRPDDDPTSTPIVAPLFEASLIGTPNERGARLGLDLNGVSLYRHEGTDLRRVSATGYWTMPWYAPAGDVWTLTAALRGDGYSVNEGEDGSNPEGAEESSTSGRLRPSASLDWRYPLVRGQGSVTQLIEPIAHLVVTPYGGNPSEIPNEDSQSLEFDDTNLFSFSRFPGLDRFEGGPRLSLGGRAAAYGAGGGFSELLVGQIFRLEENRDFAEGSGLRDEQSDYVARLTLAPASWLQLVDRVRLDQESLAVRRHEAIASIGPSALRLSFSYASLDRSLFTDELGDREALSLSLFARLTRVWSANFQYLRDIEEDGSLRSTLGLRYTDECFDFTLFADRNYTQDRDIRPSTTLGVRVRLFNLS